jgi:hypothetical protein
MLTFKKKLIECAIAQIEADLRVLTQTAQTAREAAIHSENKSEGKYDTRAIEASYLAEGQAKRAAELESLIHYFKFFEIKHFSEHSPIEPSALVKVEILDQSNVLQKKQFFMTNQGGGLELNLINCFENSFKTDADTSSTETSRISFITPSSKLGELLMGQSVGDEFDFGIGINKKSYTVIEVV